jgi:hypothetical protein
LKTLETEVSSVDSDFKEVLEHDLPQFDQALGHANLAPLAAAPGNRSAL